MSVQRILAVGLVALGATAVAHAAATLPLAVKPGLWQLTVKSDMSGMPTLPPEALAHMTPAQKARIQAQMAKANQPRTFKQCITAAELRKGFEWGNGRENRCTRAMVTSTPQMMLARVECKSANATSAGTVRFTAADSSTVRGAIDITVTTRGRTMAVKSSIAGQWLAVDCAGLKPGETR